MATTRTLTLVFFLVAGIASFSLQHHAHAASCNAIIGKWTWYIGGEVTVSPDGTFVQQSGNGGTWECTDTARGKFTLRWRQGGYVNQLVLAADGNGLSSTDPSQPFVTAKRIGAGRTAQSAKGASAIPVTATLILTTQPDGSRQLPKDLSELMHAATPRARLWRPDAIPVSLQFEHREAPNPTMRGPAVTISFSSPSAGTGLLMTVTADNVRTFEFDLAVNWGAVSLPPEFVDLPEAVRIARKNGMKGPVNRARLKIWSPSGAPPVLAWIVGDKTVNGATGELIDFDVTGYIKSYNAQWERAAEGLRALMRKASGGSSSSSFPTIGGDSSSGGNSCSSYSGPVATACNQGDGGAMDRYQKNQPTQEDQRKYGAPDRMY